MSDRYLEFTQGSFGKSLSAMLGLPQPPKLARAGEGFVQAPLQGQATLVGACAGAQFAAPVLSALKAGGASLQVRADHAGMADLKAAAAEGKLPLVNAAAPGEGEAASALVFDASGASNPEQLRQVYDFFQPAMAGLPSRTRVVIVSADPAQVTDPAAAAAQAALVGFTRSLAKELGRKGSTANLLQVGKGGEKELEGPLRFFLSVHSAFVTGQVLPVGAAPKGTKAGAWVSPLDGKVALVTGASRGIGAAIAETLAREGATVVGLDVPQAESALAETMGKIGGAGLAIDITAEEAPAQIAKELKDRFGGVDIVVHNAGITRDKLLRNMKPQFWDMVLNVNLNAILRINEKLLDGTLRAGGRMVCISSIGGIAGNAGQTNYGATKAGVIGYVAALAPQLAKQGIAANAVAPGFIETAMTDQMPMMHREVGRRLNSLSQGGKPQDIAEAVTFLASGYATGVNGQTLRVCGQNWVGA